MNILTSNMNPKGILTFRETLNNRKYSITTFQSLFRGLSSILPIYVDVLRGVLLIL